jgi:NADPH-dependent 2,4-dienoyl-CoA reductase/sulfur reductase-like enzyme
MSILFPVVTVRNEEINTINMPHALTSRDSTMETKPLGSYEKTGIDVLIVGTGLAGLVAALECTRKGHNVRVLERNADINTAGKQFAMSIRSID